MRGFNDNPTNATRALQIWLILIGKMRRSWRV